MVPVAVDTVDEQCWLEDVVCFEWNGIDLFSYCDRNYLLFVHYAMLDIDGLDLYYEDDGDYSCCCWCCCCGFVVFWVEIWRDP